MLQDSFYIEIRILPKNTISQLQINIVIYRKRTLASHPQIVKKAREIAIYVVGFSGLVVHVTKILWWYHKGFDDLLKKNLSIIYNHWRFYSTTADITLRTFQNFPPFLYMHVYKWKSRAHAQLWLWRPTYEFQYHTLWLFQFQSCSWEKKKSNNTEPLWCYKYDCKVNF